MTPSEVNDSNGLDPLQKTCVRLSEGQSASPREAAAAMPHGGGFTGPKIRNASCAHAFREASSCAPRVETLRREELMPTRNLSSAGCCCFSPSLAACAMPRRTQRTSIGEAVYITVLLGLTPALKRTRKSHT
jgi:hypothetical protein